MSEPEREQERDYEINSNYFLMVSTLSSIFLNTRDKGDFLLVIGTENFFFYFLK